MRRFALAAAALVFAGFAATPAFADTTVRSAAPQIAVEYDDLNLSTSAGADAMLDRLEAASRRVCRSAGSGYRGLERRYARQACAEATLGAAVASLGSPVVTAHYEGAPSAPIVIAAAS